MSISLGQLDFDENRKSHRVAADRIVTSENTQFDETLRAASLYARMKGALDTAELKTELGTIVGTDAVTRYTAMKAKTAAILQFQADAQGITLGALLDDLKTVTQPAEFTAARAAIASA